MALHEEAYLDAFLNVKLCSNLSRSISHAHLTETTQNRVIDVIERSLHNQRCFRCCGVVILLYGPRVHFLDMRHGFHQLVGTGETSAKTVGFLLGVQSRNLK